MFKADKLFINGKFYSMVSEEDTFEAMAIYDGKIIETGSNEEIGKYDAKEVVDLKGKTVLPGFTDTHLHMMLDCDAKEKVDLAAVTTLSEMIEKMREAEKQLSNPESWLQGVNFHIDTIKEGRFPNRFELDQISMSRPIAIQSYCGHAHIVNSKVMDIVGIDKNFTKCDPELIDKDEDGEPNGVLRESVFSDFVLPILPEPIESSKYRRDLANRYIMDYAEAGLTTLQTFSSLSGDMLEYLNMYKYMEEAGELPIRIVVNTCAEPPKGIGAVSGCNYYNDKIKYGAKKIFSDGSLSSRTAALRDDYSDMPGERGVMVHSQESLNAEVKNAYDMGMEVAIHAIGDRALDMVLDAIENAYDPQSENKNRFRIIHVQIVWPEQIERMKKLPVILDVQPGFIMNWVDIAVDRLGKERMAYMFPFRSMMDAGLILTGGSDACVVEARPLEGIECAVTRKDCRGRSENILAPDESISVFEAASMFTRNAAYCTREEEIKGTLEVGKYADLVVLDENLFEVPVETIHNIKVCRTVVAGKTVYES